MRRVVKRSVAQPPVSAWRVRRATVARTVAWLGLIGLAVPALTWTLASPMLRLAEGYGLTDTYFPPGEPEGRLHYLHDVVVSSGEHVAFATCIGCSVQISGTVYRGVLALWGDVHVASGGDAGEDIEVIGGRLVVDSGGRARYTEPRRAHWYYPGQRHVLSDDALAFVCLFGLIVAAGASAPSAAQAERIDANVRRPLRSAAVGLAAWAATPVFMRVFGVVLYVFPPTWLVLIAMLFGVWIALGCGCAALAFALGGIVSSRENAHRHAIGGVILAASLLIPVVGILAMAVVMVVGVGAGLPAVPGLSRHARQKE